MHPTDVSVPISGMETSAHVTIRMDLRGSKAWIFQTLPFYRSIGFELMLSPLNQRLG